MNLYLIRHTAVAVDRSVCYGQTDVDLLDTYETEKERIISLLPQGPFDVWSSPLGRCRRLANDLAESVHYDNRLKEFHFGQWEMQAWNAIPTEELNPWMADFVEVRVPGGETFRELYDRVADFWQSELAPLAAEADRTVALVTHGGVIRCLLSLFLELSLRNAYRLHLDYGSVSRVSVQPTHYTIHYINR